MRSTLFCVVLFTSFVLPIMADSQGINIVSLKEEQVIYKVNDVVLQGFVVFDQAIAGKRPAILVVHEWWGLNDYAKNRARQLASLGYIAMAVDMYGEGKNAQNPQQAQEMAAPFYKNPALSKVRMDAAIEKIKEFKQTDVANIGAIGYCFGGSVVLNSAKLGSSLKGVVSFHGGLAGVAANKDLLKAKVLVCHGEDDKFVPQKDIDALKQAMDSIHADYTFKSYPGATHAFTNPDATRIGKEFNMPIAYNEVADKNSWQDMKSFFVRIFPKK